MTAKGEGAGGRMEKVRVSRCKLLYIYRERERENGMEKQQGPTA